MRNALGCTGLNERLAAGDAAEVRRLLDATLGLARRAAFAAPTRARHPAKGQGSSASAGRRPARPLPQSGVFPSPSPSPAR